MANLVRDIDNDLCIIVFWATLVNLTSVYYAIALVNINDTAMIIAVLFHLLNNIVVFFLTCYSASELSDTVKNISLEAHLLLENPKMPPMKHLRFLFVVDKGVHLTVWKLFPLRRNSILTSIGTMITYAVLIENILRK
ncbi:hypothetical protein JTE90_008504 [Oedothorax gibbosus]|uniref:Gustatory receptor n=1 Tax=Oedothorax gibbosus TaxID=931172 RepID=A0AAV6UZ79_9ARAC|nr:hypothetical protein JTE90_008504 [Oedothorax gibbosus]